MPSSDSAGRPGRSPSARVLMAGALCAQLAACDLTEPYAAPAFPFGPFGEAGGHVVMAPDEAWWKGLRARELDRLVELALDRNVDLAIARERTVEAAAVRDGIAPLVSLDRTAGLGARAGDTGGSLRAEVGAALTVLLDPYGARTARVEAASARVEASDALAAQARLIVVGDVSRAYVEMRRAQRLVALQVDAITARRALVERATALVEAGRGDKIDALRARAELADAQARLPALKAETRIAKRRLAALAGLTGEPLDWLDAPRGQPLPELGPDLVLPADLLRRRPDIHAQERLYYAAVAEIGAERAALYPRLSLSGTISLGATLDGGTASVFAGPSLSLPALPADAARAGVRRAYSAARRAHAEWTATVRDAILEAETALLRHSGAHDALRIARRAAALRTEAAELTRDLVSRGDATLAELIEAEQDLTAARVVQAEATATLALAYVALNVALGLGAGTGEPPAAPPWHEGPTPPA